MCKYSHTKTRETRRDLSPTRRAKLLQSASSSSGRAKPILIVLVALELLGDFGSLVHGAPRRLILTRMFIVPVIVVIFRAAGRVRGENQALKLARGV